MSALRLNHLPLLFPVLLALMLGYLLGNARSELNAQSSFNLSWEEEELFETFWQVWEYVRGEFVDPNGAGHRSCIPDRWRHSRHGKGAR